MDKVHVALSEGSSTKMKFHIYISVFTDVMKIWIFLKTTEREVHFCWLYYNVRSFIYFC